MKKNIKIPKQNKKTNALDERQYDIKTDTDFLNSQYERVLKILKNRDINADKKEYEYLNYQLIVGDFLRNIAILNEKDPRKLLERGISVEEFFSTLKDFNKHMFNELNEREKEHLKKLPYLKRGQIVYLQFGWKVGTEWRFPHYAVIVDTNLRNNRKPKHVMVVPLSTYKEKEIKAPDILLGKVNDLAKKDKKERLTIAKVSQMTVIDTQRLLKPIKSYVNKKENAFLENEYLDKIDEMIAKTYTKIKFNQKE